MSEARAGRGELVALAGLLAIYAAALWLYFVPALGSPDANCYHVSARMLAEQGTLHQSADDPLAYVGHLWLRAESGDYYPKYPPLYPALAAGVELLFGFPAGLYVNVVAAWLAVLFTYLAARSFLPGWAAVLTAAFQASGPVFNSMAVDQIAHAPSVALLAASAAWFLNAARGRRLLGLGGLPAFVVSGLLLGVAGGVRYTNVLLALPWAIWFAAAWKRGRPATLRNALGWGLGLALPWALVAWYHWDAFGSPLRTAYALTSEQTAFSLDHFRRNLRRYARGLLTLGFGPVMLLAPVGWVLGRGVAGCRLAYLAWIVPLALLYLTYYYAPEQQVLAYVRFLLPLQLPVLLLAVSALVALAGPTKAGHANAGTRLPRVRLAVLAAVVLGQLGWGLAGSLRQLELRSSFNDMVRRRVEFAREVIPPGSTLFATRWLLDDLDYHVDRERDGRHLYENDLVDQVWLTRVVGQFLEKDSIQRERVEAVRALLVDVPFEQFVAEVSARIDASLDAGRPVYLIGTDPVRVAFEANFGHRFTATEVAVLPTLEPRHRLMTLPRSADLSANPAWGESSILLIERSR